MFSRLSNGICRSVRTFSPPVGSAFLRTHGAPFGQIRFFSQDISSFLNERGIKPKKIIHNAPPAILYEEAIRYEPESFILESGALATLSNLKTGRSPKDKRVVKEPSSQDVVDWGEVNIPFSPESFMLNREQTTAYLSTLDRLYVVDGYAGWDPRYQKKIRIICERPYHALFMQVMLIRPSLEQLKNFGTPDLVIMNGGRMRANVSVPGVKTPTSIAVDFGRREMVILGSEYAGEMKKGVLTYMMYTAMRENCVPLHASMNQGKDLSTTLFFGLSGTGKTTLSADPSRNLIGDDEHVWTDTGCYNIEGGCYAKCIDLKREQEPEIYDAIRFGAIVENVKVTDRRAPIYTDRSITENSRCAYPLEHIPGAVIPSVGKHPNNVIFLTCDAFGVLPPVSRLTPEQASYHFISGYTAKVAGTEMNVVEPVPNFSACYGGPFLVYHPREYAKVLSSRLREHGSNAWLINTGWNGGKYGVGKRISLKHTRAIIDRIHDGTLQHAKFDRLPEFGLEFVTECEGIPSKVLDPRQAWSSAAEYEVALKNLAKLFANNFKRFSADVDESVKKAGPTL